MRSSRIRRTGGIIVPLAVMFFWASAALALDAPNARLSDDIALTKATISLLAAKNFAAVRDRLDPVMGKISDDTLRQMSDVIGPGDPISVETISSAEARNLQTGDGNSRIILEYELTGKWVVAGALIKTNAASKRFLGLHFTVNALPLKELNAFRLLGKEPVQYLFLAGWIAAILLTALAISAAFRRHRGWRKWALIFLMPLGLTPTVAMNWTTAQMLVLEAASTPAHVIPVLSFRYPMALFSHTEVGAPFLYVSAPLIAFGYLIWHWGWSKRRAPLASLADPF
jgi:hypothetical protein